MVHIEFKELVPLDIKAVAYIEYLNIAQDKSDLKIELADQSVTKHCFEPLDNTNSSYNADTQTRIIHVDRPKEEGQNVEFNIIALLASPSELEVNNPEDYLGIIAWDNKILSSDEFDKFYISYRLQSVISESSKSIATEIAYINHKDEEDVLEETTTYQPWNTHSVLNQEYLGNKVQNVQWIFKGNRSEVLSKKFTTNNIKSDVVINGSDGQSIEVPRTQNVNILNGPGYIFKCIPEDYSIKSAKLMVNPKYGVGFYNPETGLVTTSGYTYYLAPLPTILENSNYEVYQYGKNATIFYDCDNYNVYVSTYTPSGTNKWSECWKVGGSSSLIKIIIPSYFDIFPFAFINYLNWRVCFVSSFADDSSVVSDRPFADDLVLKVYDDCYSSSGSILADEFFSSTKYLNSYIGNIVSGYQGSSSNNYKDKIKSYIWSQLYVSYQTLKQALRYNSNQDTIKIKDTGILYSDYFIPYSQEFGVHNFKYSTYDFNKRKKSSNAIKIEGLTDIDNFIAKKIVDNTESIVSLVSSGNAVSFENIDNIQMKHGIIVGFDNSENKYVQLQ